MRCLLCNSKNTKFKFIYKGNDIYLEKLNIDFKLKWYECKKCGVFFSKQYKNIQKVYENKNLYDAQYDEKMIYERYNKILNLKNSDNKQRVKRVKEYHNHFINLFSVYKKRYKVLDLGAGLGVFLKEFIDDRYEVEAVELNKIAVKHLKKIDIKVYNKDINKLNLEKKFDLITLNRVLEHIKKPIKVLKQVNKLLQNKGLLYVELPDSLSYNLDSNKNEAFASGHYMVYNPKSIYYFFKKSGFEILHLSRVKENSGKYTIYIFGVKNEIL